MGSTNRAERWASVLNDLGETPRRQLADPPTSTNPGRVAAARERAQGLGGGHISHVRPSLLGLAFDFATWQSGFPKLLFAVSCFRQLAICFPVITRSCLIRLEIRCFRFPPPPPPRLPAGTPPRARASARACVRARPDWVQPHSSYARAVPLRRTASPPRATRVAGRV